MKVPSASGKYLNDVEDRMDSCHDPVKILMSSGSGRKGYAAGGGVNSDGFESDMGTGRKMKPVDNNMKQIKVAMMSTKPNSKASKQSQMRADMRTGPAYKAGGEVCANAINSQKGMAEKMGLDKRMPKAMGGVGKVRKDQY